LGQNDTFTYSSPVQITTDSDWRQISASVLSSFAIKNNGTLWSWGDGNFGILGNGDTIDLSSPAQVGSLSNWSSVSVNSYNAVALKENGTLWAWGEGDGGALGNGYTAIVSSPVQVGTASNWASASAGSSNVVALKSNGTLWVWGDNYNGKLGNGTENDSSSPIQISSDKNWKFVSAGGYNSTMSITDDTSINYPLPAYTFRVNVIDYTSIVSQNLPDRIEHIILNLENQTVYVSYVDKPLKHGDTFTLYGQKAIKCYQQYIGKLPKILELVD
jgi:alpha-tubulin suppressor-like RCC1 family protein